MSHNLNGEHAALLEAILLVDVIRFPFNLTNAIIIIRLFELSSLKFLYHVESVCASNLI